MIIIGTIISVGTIIVIQLFKKWNLISDEQEEATRATITTSNIAEIEPTIELDDLPPSYDEVMNSAN